MRLIDADAEIDAIRTKYCPSDFMDDGVIDALVEIIQDLPSAQPEVIRCKDCKYFEYDHAYIIQGIPVLGHEVCNAWGDGCKTDENGFCFMAERRAEKEEVTA